MADSKAATVIEKFLKADSVGKLDGSRANNRFGFQEAWSLLYILNEHHNLGDYLAVFDLHEDFVVFDSSGENPKNAQLFQIKTKISPNAWTASQLVSKRKLKGSSYKKSYLEKLFASTDVLSDIDVKLYFVANGQFKMSRASKPELIQEKEFVLGTVVNPCRGIISKGLGKEFPGEFSSTQTNTILMSSTLSLDPDERETTIRGALTKFIEKTDSKASYRLDPILHTLMSVVTGKSRYEFPLTSASHLKKKSFDKSEFEKQIRKAITRSETGPRWELIEPKLDVSSIDISWKLQAGFTWAQNQILENSKVISELQSLLIPIINDEGKTTNSLSALVEVVFQKSQKLGPKIPQAILDEFKIKGLILYEVFKEGRISEAGAQSAGENI